jgi:hypothetical protein
MSLNGCALEFGFYDENHLIKELNSLLPEKRIGDLLSQNLENESMPSFILKRSKGNYAKL